MIRKLAVMVGVASLLMCVARIGWADLSLGSLARQTAMGGAGLALTDDPVVDAAVNPAALAYSNGFQFQWPNLDFRGRGAAGLGDVIDHISQQTDISAQDAINLARDFATGPTTMQLNVSSAVLFPALGVSAGGYGKVDVTPNDLLMNWANDPAAPVNPPDSAQAVVQAGAIYALPSVALAQRVKSSGGGNSSVALGVRVNWLHSISFLDTVSYDGSGGVSTTNAQPVKNQDWSADVGLIYALKKPIGAKVALVATDVRKPSLPGLNVETVVNGGFAMTTPLGLIVAADVRNITKAYGEQMTLHAGAEWKLGPIALRAGTSTKGSGWSTGIGIQQFNLSFTPKSAFDAATTIFF